MKPVVRLGDKSMGESEFPPTLLTEGSQNVFANGISVGAVGSKWKPHTRKVEPNDTHTEICVEGSSTVYANGVPLCRIGDKLAFDDVIIEGSQNVFAGG